MSAAPINDPEPRLKSTLTAERGAPMPRSIASALRTTHFEPPRRRWPGILATSAPSGVRSVDNQLVVTP